MFNNLFKIQRRLMLKIRSDSSNVGSFDSPSYLTNDTSSSSAPLYNQRYKGVFGFDEYEDFVELRISNTSQSTQEQEISIVNYLVSLGLQMKTDPLIKSKKWKDHEPQSVVFTSTQNSLLQRRQKFKSSTMPNLDKRF